MKKNIITTSIAIIALPLLAACSQSTNTPYPKQHAKALMGSDQRVTLPEQFVNLQALFSDLKQDDLAEQIDEVYAQDLYFNDTIHTFSDRESLKAYILATAEKVNKTTTVFEDVAKSGDNYYLRWRMQVEADIGVKTIVSESIGMTQLRFNEQGKVVFHQDFWDNTEGFFRHVPIVGGMIKQIKKRL